MLKRGISSKGQIRAAHPVDRVFGLIKPSHPTDSLALLDQMRGPRPGGRRARRK